MDRIIKEIRIAVLAVIALLFIVLAYFNPFAARRVVANTAFAAIDPLIPYIMIGIVFLIFFGSLGKILGIKTGGGRK